jgi:glycosyltransferase involved in cell wall biosynthesis
MAAPPVSSEPRIVVLLPCYNEEVSVAQCVKAFRQALPTATVYVYDNNSTDRTSEVALAAGAVVRRESRKGKGNVVRRMFSDVDADIYVMADGDATYDANTAPMLVNYLLEDGLDMVVGCRKPVAVAAYRPGHKFGNKLLTTAVGLLFGNQFTDMLSGYRVFSRRFVKSFPALSRGFETETELTIHALELRLPVGEIITQYYGRVEGSSSKLSTVKDGLRILAMILRLFKLERPLLFYSIIAALLATASIILGIPILAEYFETGLVPRFPTAILASALMLLAAIAFIAGTILETVTRGRIELKRLTYLNYAPVTSWGT